MVWDGLQLTLMELVRTTKETFMIFYSNIVILKNGAKINMIRILPFHAYQFVTLGLYL